MQTNFLVHRSSKTASSVAEALESVQGSSKSAARKILLEIKQIYNSFKLQTVAAENAVRESDRLHSQVYQRYYPCFQRGIY